MITEDYVSFETAKLLKEKGFDIPLNYYYNSDGRKWYVTTSYNWNQTTGDFPDYSCPTLQMAMKWLREVHYYNIEIDTLGMMELNTLSWRSTVYYLVNENECYCEDGFDSYEEACEAAIKYCLEKLI